MLTDFEKGHFCSIGNAFEFIDVLRVGLFHRLEDLLVVPSHFVRLVLVQEDVVQVLVARQERLNVALEGPPLKYLSNNYYVPPICCRRVLTMS